MVARRRNLKVKLLINNFLKTMEQTRDLSRLYKAIFSPVADLREDLPEEQSKRGIRWRYVANYYPWLVRNFYFAKAFLSHKLDHKESKIQDNILNVLNYLHIEEKEITEAEIMTFLSAMPRDKLIKEFYYHTFVVSYPRRFLLKQAFSELTYDSLPKFIKEIGVILNSLKYFIKDIAILSIEENREDLFKSLIVNFSKSETLVNFLKATIIGINKARNTKWLDIVLGKSEKQDYEELVINIFSDTGFLLEESGVGNAFFIKYMSKLLDLSLEELFTRIEPKVNGLEKNKNIIYTSFLMAGLSTQFITNYLVEKLVKEKFMQAEPLGELVN